MAKDNMGSMAIVTATAVALALSTGAMAQTQEQPSDAQTQADQKLEQAQQRVQEETAKEQSAEQSAKDQPGAEAEEQAAQEQSPSPPEGPFIVEQDEDTLLASELQGLTIVGADGEEIGEIEDLILHPEGGIFGATVSVGGFLGMGGKDVALSWTQFDYSVEEQLARVNATREQLEEAPDFTTLAEMRAEQEAAAAQQQMQQQQGATGTAPQPATGTQ